MLNNQFCWRLDKENMKCSYFPSCLEFKMNFMNNEKISPDFTTSQFKSNFEKGDFS